MNLKIVDKFDQNAVNEITNMGYPDSIKYMGELLSWTCDPNWPIADSIYKYLISLGRLGVTSVLNTAEEADYDWRYSLITQVIASYNDETLIDCVEHLRKWATQPGTNECDFESLRILTDRELIEDIEIAEIAKRNLFVYNVWIKETLEAAGGAIHSFPLSDHKL